MEIDRQIPASWHKDGKTHVLIIKGERFVSFIAEDAKTGELQFKFALQELATERPCRN